MTDPEPITEAHTVLRRIADDIDSEGIPTAIVVLAAIAGRSDGEQRIGVYNDDTPVWTRHGMLMMGESITRAEMVEQVGRSYFEGDDDD